MAQPQGADNNQQQYPPQHGTPGYDYNQTPPNQGYPPPNQGYPPPPQYGDYPPPPHGGYPPPPQEYPPPPYYAGAPPPPQPYYVGSPQPVVIVAAPRRKRLSVVGWVSIIILLLIFWPLCWVPCVIPSCYEEVD
eukprot:TRINITY_DN2060_c0_g1_i1.p1 TRINITY_DN2060_c0_g1~~TRINITY_DN2060_c0_g1_i1.p1  ORF type:complete len:134 (-),score=28.91 TRINITY_DN2060_c0_g1_i1:94-495(-)